MTVTAQVHALHTLIRDRWPGGTEDRLCAELVRVLPRTLSVLALSAPDGWPTSTPGAPDRGGSSGSYDRVGGLVARREAAATAYSALCRLVAVSAAHVAQSDRRGAQSALQRALAVTDDWHLRLTEDEKKQNVKNAKCARKVQGDKLGAPWVDDLCENIADVGRKGLCEACYRRRYNALRALEERV